MEKFDDTTVKIELMHFNKKLPPDQTKESVPAVVDFIQSS